MRVGVTQAEENYTDPFNTHNISGHILGNAVYLHMAAERLVKASFSWEAA